MCQEADIKRTQRLHDLIAIILLALATLAANARGGTAVAGAGLDRHAAAPALPEASMAGATIRLVSRAMDGAPANGWSLEPSLSANGRYVAFASGADNLVAGDQNGWDIFVRDLQTGHVDLVSVASDGAQANDTATEPAISGDGRYVAFSSNASNLAPDAPGIEAAIYVRDRVVDVTNIVSVASDGTQANSWSAAPSISDDGRYVAFVSNGSNLVPDDTNQCLFREAGCPDIFVHDRQTGETERVSVASDGTEGNGESSEPAISADGRFVAFQSWASNLVSGDNNHHTDIFVHDRQTGETRRVSIASDGTEANHRSFRPAISADGRTVAFMSEASNLVAGDTNICVTPAGMRSCYDVFVHDRQTGKTTRVSIASDGTEGNGDVGYPGALSLSADGRYVAFISEASNLAAGDTNGVADYFIHDRVSGETRLLAAAVDAAAASLSGFEADFSGDGRHFVFVSESQDLVTHDGDDFTYIYLYDGRMLALNEEAGAAGSVFAVSGKGYAALGHAEVAAP